MRAAALALVLICGAAVVLWYGNMLNSWILGGLIGGLAALLLSIPISLALFSYLSRRHDEQRQAEKQERMSLAQVAYYKHAPVSVLESSPYALGQQEEEEWSEDESHYSISSTRNVPVPSSSRVPVRRQNQQVALVARQRMNDYSLARQQQPGAVSANRTIQQNQRGTAQRQGQGMYLGSYSYQSKSVRGTQQTAALRAAREEAARHGDDASNFSSGPLNRLPPLRRDENPGNSHIISRQFQPPSQRQYPPGSIGIGSSTLSNAGRAASPGIERTKSQPLPEFNQHPAASDPRTDTLGTRQSNLVTGPMRLQQQQQQQQTGQASRRPRVDAQPRNPDIVTGSLKNPMTRRAPYMYEDDPLRQELARQLEPPSVRRSSLARHYDEYDAYGDEAD
jgi:hypothetical protein